MDNIIKSACRKPYMRRLEITRFEDIAGFADMIQVNREDTVDPTLGLSGEDLYEAVREYLQSGSVDDFEL